MGSNEMRFMREIKELDESIAQERMGDSREKSKDSPDNTIMLLDRSTNALASMLTMNRILKEHGMAHVLPDPIKLWLKSPENGHFLVFAINHLDRRMAHVINDDLDQILLAVEPMLRSFVSAAPGNGAFVWAPMLASVNEPHFLRWLNEKRKSA